MGSEDILRVIIFERETKLVVCNYDWDDTSPVPDVAAVIKVALALGQFARTFEDQTLCGVTFSRDGPLGRQVSMLQESEGCLVALVLYDSEDPDTEQFARAFALRVFEDLRVRQSGAWQEFEDVGRRYRESGSGAESNPNYRPFRVSKLQAYYRSTVEAILDDLEKNHVS